MKGRKKFRGVPHHLPHIMGAMVCMAATHGMGLTVILTSDITLKFNFHYIEKFMGMNH